MSAFRFVSATFLAVTAAVMSALTASHIDVHWSYSAVLWALAYLLVPKRMA